MSEDEAPQPAGEDLLSEVTDLRAERVIGAQLLAAARARADQDALALRDTAADRDRWKAAAEGLQSELWRQVDELRAESAQQHEQITQLSVSLAALLEAIVGTAPAAVVDSAPGAAVVPAPAAPPPAQAVVEPFHQAADQPVAVPTDAPAAAPRDRVAAAAPTAEPVPVPSPAPAVMLSPYVPANEPPRPVVATRDRDEPPPVMTGDRVGVLTELMAVAVDSVPATGTSAEHAVAPEDAPRPSTAMTILPAEEPVSAKRRRLPRVPSRRTEGSRD